MLLPALRRACADGVLASLFSGLALLRGSRSDHAHLVGRSEYRVGRPPLKTSAAGIALHAATGLVWGALYDRLRATRRRPTRGNAVSDALLLTAIAVGVDRVVTPSVLTPGADKRATASGTRRPSVNSLLLVYGAFAAGLALGGMHALKRHPSSVDEDDEDDHNNDNDDGYGDLFRADPAPRRAGGRA
ncbi:hypothetical protein ABE85_08185 [Mitsuaria sp. 7]|nr:hypothetical protein ABE85_08185 [Mitsuaria sp. 7]